MKANYNNTILELLREVREISKALPGGKARQIYNRCDKIAVALRKANRSDDSITGAGVGQGDNPVGKAAIYAALLEGRRLSQMDIQEFGVEDMRTPVSHLSTRIQEEGHTLNRRWIPSRSGKRKVMEYWVERGDVQ